MNPSSDEAGMRLDAFLAEKIDGWSRSRLQRLIENEDVLVNEKKVKPSYKLRENDEVEVDLVELPVARFEPENIPLDIVYEDEYLAVINKPAGMVVHPGAGVQSGTLANAIAFHFAESFAEQNKQDPDNLRIGIVHRLDKDTSGLIVVAKTDEIHEELSEQFRERLVYKSYIALVHGSAATNIIACG
jgi:23S rRNA pseudouridine1911/1915/1917 synthase